MKAVIGLGNPGARYRRTRHNIGFMLVDALSARHHVKFKGGKGEYMVGICEKLDTAFIKPLTFMNNSGIAVKDVIKRYNVELEDLLVVYDDLDLNLGRFKFKKDGSGGTHNGMKSIMYHLNTDSFPRLKIGIDVDGRRENGDSIDFVLNNFSRSEKEVIANILPEACNATESFLVNGLERTMNTYNQR